MEKFQETRKLALEIRGYLEQYQESRDMVLLEKAKEAAGQIAEI